MYTRLIALFLFAVATTFGQDRGLTVQGVAHQAHLDSYDPGKIQVLLIGINSYENWPALVTPEADVKAVAAELISDYAIPERNIALVTGKDATRVGILKALEAKMEAAPDESLIVYYAGHGWMDKRKNGFWVPVEAKTDEKFGFISNAQVVDEYFRKYEGKHLLVIADSCFAGAMLRGWTDPLPGRELPAGFSKPSRWILASGDLEQVPDDAGNGHSPFANRLLQYLKYADRPVFGVNDLYVFVRQNVDSEVIAQPINTPHHVPGGELVLVRGTNILPVGQPTEASAPTAPQAGTPTRIERVGSIAVLSYMTGELSLDGKVMATVGPGFRYPLNDVRAGAHELRIVQGDQTWSRNVEVYEGKTTSIEARLTPPAAVVVTTPTLGKEWYLETLNMDFRHIFPGSFLRGSQNAEEDERPVHPVKISSDFWMGATEVTVGQFLLFLRDSNQPEEDEYNRLLDVKHSWGKWRSKSAADLPVSGVNWQQARDFCEWLSKREGQAGRLPPGYVYRLPTESEWEFAAKCGINKTWFFGVNRQLLPKYAWFKDNADEEKQPVAKLSANGYGLYDVYGNVAEWCLDSYVPYSQPAVTPLVDPLATSAVVRVARGGSYEEDAEACQSASRHGYHPLAKTPEVGFRVVLAPKR